MLIEPVWPNALKPRSPEPRNSVKAHSVHFGIKSFEVLIHEALTSEYRISVVFCIGAVRKWL